MLRNYANVPALLACACMLVGCHPWGEPGISEIDIGIDIRIDAIIFVPESISDRGLGLFAAASGMIVDQDGQRWELSSHALRALATDSRGRYWACGDQGYLAFTEVDQSSEATPTWTPLDSGSQANFHALAATAERVVVVGDDILLIGVEADGAWQWSEPAPPSGGWGRLRAVEWISDNDTVEILAVGLGGRALLSSDNANTWTALDGLDAGTDFELLCGGLALGEGLSHARWRAGEWLTWGGGAGADYLGCGGQYVLSSDRWISKLNSRGIDHIYRLPWQGRAFDPAGIFVAGDGGHVAVWNPAEVGEY